MRAHSPRANRHNGHRSIAIPAGATTMVLLDMTTSDLLQLQLLIENRPHSVYWREDKGVELCFECLETPSCPVHPWRVYSDPSPPPFSQDAFSVVPALEHEHKEHAWQQWKRKQEQVLSDHRREERERRAELKRSLDPEDEEKIVERSEGRIQPLVIEGPKPQSKRQRSRGRFVCDECGTTFTLKQNVQSHISIFHMGGKKFEKKKRWQCVPCGQLFKSAANAEKHEQKVHRVKIKKDPSETVCDHCGKVFASRFQLKEHISILHLNERNFQCEQCPQKFGRRGGLRRHVQMVHMGQLHRCPYDGCDHPGYKCSKALAAHIRSVHTGVRPFACTLCAKAFVRRNDLNMHTLTHSKAESFVCACGSSFRRQNYLKKHQKSCDACSQD